MDKPVEVSQAARDAAGDLRTSVADAISQAVMDCNSSHKPWEIIDETADQLVARFEATTRATQPEAALREAAAQIIAKDASHELDLGLLRQTHETGFKGGIRYCANILAATLSPAEPSPESREGVIEECAKVAEAIRERFGSPTGKPYDCGLWDQAIRIASAIRALKGDCHGVR